MNDLTIFENPDFGRIRSLKIENEPWFVGKDIAEALGYKNTKDALANHVDNEDRRILKKSQISTIENHLPKDVFPMNFVGAEFPTRGLIIINESGLYSLMLKSKLPGAKKFKRWITSEVLPSIRKAGVYTMPTAAPADDAMFERLWVELERKQKFNGYVGQFCNFFGWSRHYYLSGMYNLMKRAGCNVDALTLRMQAATHDYAMSTAQAVIMDEQAFELFCKIAEYGIQRNHIPKTMEEAFL